MNPYRPLFVLVTPPRSSSDDGTRLAYAVMTIVGAVPLVVPSVPLIQTAFGALCAAVGASLLVRSRITSAASPPRVHSPLPD